MPTTDDADKYEEQQHPNEDQKLSGAKQAGFFERWMRVLILLLIIFLIVAYIYKAVNP